jgi:hypothetical protein
MSVTTGVKKYEGSFAQNWYGWAYRGTKHLEGPFRTFKWRARIDAWKLGRKLRSKP